MSRCCSGLLAALLFFGALIVAPPVLGSYDSGAATPPSIGISSFFPSDTLGIIPGGNGTVIVTVANGGNAEASNVSLSSSAASCCNISAFPKSANIPQLGSRNFTITVSAAYGSAAGAFVAALAAKSLEGSASSSSLTINVLPAQATTTPTLTGIPMPVPTPMPRLCATCPAGWLPGVDDCAPPCPSGMNCPMSVMRCPQPTQTPDVCPPQTTNSCCARTYSLPGCVPQDAPDSSKCSKNEYCSEACVCLSNKCSSYKAPDSCSANPACGWCSGDGKCKKIHEVVCQPLGCNGPGLYCAKSCGWSACRGASSECKNGLCAEPKGKPKQNESIPEESQVDIVWGDWRPLSAVAGGEVSVTRDIGVKLKGAKKYTAVGTAWRNYAKEMEAAGWRCTGEDTVVVPPSPDSVVPMALNCTFDNVVTAVGGGWTGEENGTMELQYLSTTVSGRNTDGARQYQNVRVATAACLPSFSCPEQSLAVLGPSANYSIRVMAFGNAVSLLSTRGSSDGGNYAQIEVKNSLESVDFTNLTGWLDFDERLVSNRTLNVMTEGRPADITPSSKCPLQHDAFRVGGQTWKSCEGTGRFEFIIPVLGRGATVVVRASGLNGVTAVETPLETAAASGEGTSSVKSIGLSYSHSEVFQNSAGAISPSRARPKAVSPSQASPSPAGPETTTTSSPEPMATTVPATTVAWTATPEATNIYVKTIESLSGIRISTEPSARESLEEETAKASSALAVERIIEPSPEKSTVSVLLENKGAETLRNVVVFEKVPKSVAESAGEITGWRVNGVPKQPDRIVEPDPVLAFIFEAVPAGKVETIEYDVKKEVKASGAKEYSAPVVVAYAIGEQLNSGGEGVGAFSFMAVLQKWVGNWLFRLVVVFFAMVVAASYIGYRWIRSKTE